MVTSEVKNQWLTIMINDILHLSIYLPNLVKVQSWANHPRWFQFWKSSRYFIETTHKTGIQDHSDYADKMLWKYILHELYVQTPKPA